jgi:hypothetical protein
MAFVRSAVQNAPCVFEATSATAGVGRCKKGDAVVRFTSESAFAGAAVVFEAKHDATYTVQRALDELDAARKNRNAVAGVFIMAQSHAGEALPRYSRHGSNVLVVSDLRPEGWRRSYRPRRRWALPIRFLRLSRKSWSFLRVSMCSEIAVRITSETGRLSTVATVSKASACSAESRMVIAFAGFMERLWCQDAGLVNDGGGMVAWCHEVNMTEPQEPNGGNHPREFRIQIDRTHYTVTQEHMTGAQLRQVPNPPIGPDRDLWEVVPGAPDLKIGDTDTVEIRNGMRFFTAPAQINPGRR